LPEVEPSATLVTKDDRATTTTNNYNNTNIRAGRTKAMTETSDRGGARPWMAQRARGGCINRAFRKEMTPADANFVETVTQRNFRSQNLPQQPPPTN
jgi:hypothetical protein